MYSGESINVVLSESGIAELCIDLQGSSVNIFTAALRSELASVITQLNSHSGIKGLLIYSAKSTFILGADINQFIPTFSQGIGETAEWAYGMHRIFNDIEDLPFPTLCALNGIAVGGGMELALSMDFRVAETSAKLGLPEVNLGLCPGWGGTVRLSRVAGLEVAFDWMLSGKQNPATQALEQGAITALAEPGELMNCGRQILLEAISGKRDYLPLRARKTGALKLDKNSPDKAQLQQQYRHYFSPNYPAAEAIFNLVMDSLALEREAATIAEANLFGELGHSKIAQNLITYFLNGQYIKKKNKQLIKAGDSVKKAAVLGAGIMGGGIAFQSASSSIPAVMKDITEEALNLGMDTAANILNKKVKRGKMDEQGKAAVLDNIIPVLRYEGFDDVDYAVEAVVEREDVKSLVLAEVEKVIKPTAILASNTSTISIDSLAANLERPEQFCGMHFFNPVHVMPMVEVIRGKQSSEQTIATTVAYATAMKKTPIVVRDCPGFVINRVLFPYFNAFNRLLFDGVEIERIDKVMEDYGWPMGPAYLADVIGLDTMVHADNVMEKGFPERMSHDNRPIVEDLLGQGALGQKNNIGFYEYSIDEKGKRHKSLSPLVQSIIKEKVKEKKDVSDQSIIDRMMIPMCLEVARCLEDGIVESVAEADMALVLSISFPRFRGGPLKYIDDTGIRVFCDAVKANANNGPLYQLTEGLQQRLETNKNFY